MWMMLLKFLISSCQKTKRFPGGICGDFCHPETAILNPNGSIPVATWAASKMSLLMLNIISKILPKLSDFPRTGFTQCMCVGWTTGTTTKMNNNNNIKKKSSIIGDDKECKCFDWDLNIHYNLLKEQIYNWDPAKISVMRSASLMDGPQEVNWRTLWACPPDHCWWSLFHFCYSNHLKIFDGGLIESWLVIPLFWKDSTNILILSFKNINFMTVLTQLDHHQKS